MDFPPPPPVPQGTVPSKAPGNGGPSNGGGTNGGTGTGTGALAALALLPSIPIPAKETRPGYCGAGRQMPLCVTYFRAKLTKAEDVYHYNVSTEPAVTNKKVSRDIFKKMRETFGQAECGGKNGAYDGEKSFFTSGSLNFNTKEFPVFLDNRKGPTFRAGDRGRRQGDTVAGPSKAHLEGVLVWRWHRRGGGRLPEDEILW